MSVKNKAKDRGHNGRIRRKYTSRHKNGVHYNKSSSWWVTLFNTRPRRREETHLCGQLSREAVEADELNLPVGNQKANEYYW